MAWLFERWFKRGSGFSQSKLEGAAPLPEPILGQPQHTLDTQTTVRQVDVGTRQIEVGSILRETSFSEPLVIDEPSPSFEPRPPAAIYRTPPYRPDCIIDGWAAEKFVIRAASLRGRQHRYNGAPRQDDFAISFLRDPDRLLVAVADGVSSAKQSHLGSTIAVRYALNWLAERILSGAPIDWTILMQHCAWQLVEQSKLLFPSNEKHSTDAAHAESLFATTLLCAVIEFPTGAASGTARIAGVGDTGAWLLSNKIFSHVYGGKTSGDTPITSSAVSGLPQVPKILSEVEVVLVPGSILLLGSDGIGDPLGSGDGLVGQTLREKLATPPSMLEFAHLVDFSKNTFDDDRTLVAIWPKIS